MSFDLSELYVDPGRGEEGVWVDFYSGSRLKIAYSESKRYKAAIAKLAKQHRLQLDDSNEDSYEVVQAITCRALAEHILLGWENLKINGEDAEYNKELGYQVLLQYPKMREFVVEKAGDPVTFRSAMIDTVKKVSRGR